MAKYIFKNDFKAETKFKTSGNALPPASVKKRFTAGDSIEGVSFDNGITIATTMEGKEPSGMVGQSYFEIPMVNLEPAEIVSSPVEPSQPAEKTNAAGKKLMTNIVIILIGIAILGLIFKSEK